jgi:hypothetical protein
MTDSFIFILTRSMNQLTNSFTGSTTNVIGALNTTLVAILGRLQSMENRMIPSSGTGPSGTREDASSEMAVDDNSSANEKTLRRKKRLNDGPKARPVADTKLRVRYILFEMKVLIRL